MDVYVSIHFGFDDHILQVKILLEVEITEIVVNMLQYVLLPVFNLLDFLSTLSLKLTVHVDNFVEKMVRLKAF